MSVGATISNPLNNMRRSFRLLVKRLFLPRKQHIRRLPLGIGQGIRFHVDFAADTQLYFGLYEVELNGYVRRLTHGAELCFDVGSQYGYYALILAKLTRLRVLALDCSASACGRMRDNFDANLQLFALLEIKRAFVGASDHGPTNVTLDTVALGNSAALRTL